MSGWPCIQADEACRLLFRARLLLGGYNPAHGQAENKFGAADVMKTERGNTAILRAAAVLANAAVSMLADEIEYREKVFTEEELNEMLDGQNEDVPQAPEAPNDAPSGKTRAEGETEASTPKRANRKHSKQEAEEPASADIAQPQPQESAP